MTLGAIFVATMVAMAEGNEEKVKELNKLQNEKVAEIQKKKENRG